MSDFITAIGICAMIVAFVAFIILGIGSIDRKIKEEDEQDRLDCIEICLPFNSAMISGECLCGRTPLDDPLL